MTEITQEDREAAAYLAGNTGWYAPNLVAKIQNGEVDGDKRVQAFAAHRRQAEAKVEGLLKRLSDAAREVVQGANQTFTARNGRSVSIEADDGEACLIVHSDPMFQLEAAMKEVLAHLSHKPHADEGAE